MLLPLLMLAEPPRRLRNRQRPAALLDEAIRDFFDDVVPAKVTRAEAYVDLPPAKPNGFKVEINIDGCHPDELKVDLMDDHLIVEGYHKEKDEQGGFLERKFTRKIVLPEEVDRTTIHSHLDNDILVIVGRKKEPEKPRSISIPIHIRNTRKDDGIGQQTKTTENAKSASSANAETQAKESEPRSTGAAKEK